jgi:UDP-N-acetyl-D-mannosaminuronate dehydrogenase
MPKTKVAIYGQTTEGYMIASNVIEKADVTIVDETLQMATELSPSMIRSYPDLTELAVSEPLMALKPLSRVLQEAAFIFFTPKLRRPTEESVMEANSKMRDLSKYLQKGTTFVNTLPTGPGGNAENIMLIEKQTGLKVGESISYVYSPLEPRSAEMKIVSVLASKSRPGLEELGIKPGSQGLESAELAYSMEVLGEGVRVATEIELMKKAREMRADVRRHEDSKYIDELASQLYDLRVIQASEDIGEPVTYLAGAAVKSIENYVRYLVDETRDTLREMQLKASRTKVMVMWTFDKYEVRNDRLQMAEDIVQRLRDYVTDVQLFRGKQLSQEVEPFESSKHNIAIACSKNDYDLIKQMKKTIRGVDVTIFRATPDLTHD